MDPFGPYQPLNELARGGMGAVYRARDTRSGEHVALKVILDLASDLELLERFRREVTLLRDVEHPHLVRVLDADFRPPRPWAAFELVEGGTLEQRVLRDGPLPWRDAVRIVSEIAAGVSAAHEQGLLHRDIKPANVLLGEEGAKLADFGLVKDLDRETLTQSGATLGTPAYLAPEQIGSQKARWGPATDVYGLAATLFFALTGRPPFAGGSMVSTLRAVLEDPPPPPRETNPAVPAWLDALCRRGTAKRTTERYPSAVAFRAALLSGAKGTRTRWVQSLALAVPLVLALAVGWLWLNRIRAARHLQAGRELLEQSGALDQALVELERAAALDPSAGEAHALRARALRLQGRDETALAAAQAALEANADLALAWLERGHARARLAQRAAALSDQERARKLSAALTDLDRAAQLDPRWFEAHASRARALRALGRFAEAVAAADEALALAEDGAADRAVAYRERGRAHSRTGFLAQAKDDLDRSLELNPRDAIALAERGAVHVLLERLTLASADLDRALASSPRNAFALQWRGQCLLRLKRFSEAAEDYSAAIQQEPKNAVNHLGRGEALTHLQRPEEALASLNRAIQLAPDLAKAHLLRGTLHLRQGRSALALEDFGRAVDADPRNARAYAERALLRAEQKHPEAEADCERALELDPNEARAYMARGTLRSSEQPEAALEDFKRAKSLAPGLLDAYVLSGLQLANLGRLDEARSDFDRVVELAPDSPFAYRERGAFLLKAQHYEEAARDLSRALDLAPQSPKVRVDRGLALEHLGRYQEALADYQAARRQAPDNPWIAVNCGVGHEKLGQHEQALAVYEEVLRRWDPNHPAWPVAQSRREELIRQLGRARSH